MCFTFSLFSGINKFLIFSSRAPSGAKIRVNNLHYDLTEGDLEVCIASSDLTWSTLDLQFVNQKDLFTRIGPIVSLSLRYDRAGRSEGVAHVVYKRLVDAQSAIRDFDGANAKGQPISLTLVSSGTEGRRRNPLDNAEKPRGSLFDRTERPRSRDVRSLSPGNESEGSGKIRRSDVSKPPPDHIDRYVPGQRSPRRRNDGDRNRGRRPGERRDGRNGSAAGRERRTANGRPRKTQEELDQEMEDYWGTNTSGNTGQQTTEQPAAPSTQTDQVADDDIDMIE